MSDAQARFDTRCVHAGQQPDPTSGAIMTPVYFTSTYVQQGLNQHKGFEYARTRNPTRDAVEGNLAALEGADHGIAFASGMAAIQTLLELLNQGDHMVLGDNVYGGTFRLVDKVMTRFGLTYSQVDTGDLAALEASLRPETKLVLLETPTNPMLSLTDIAAVKALLQRTRSKALLVVDNTFATPYFQQPLSLGADLVIQSVTKYLAGHLDVIQGAVIAKDAGVFEPVKFLQNALGGVPSPFDCWLTLRGVKTLELRMERHAQNAAAIADVLTAHPKVKRVYYPGLASHPGHEIAKRQMTGFGGMVSFELDGTVEDASAFVSSLTYFALGESLGGVRSLVCLPCKMTHASIPAETRAELGLSDSLIRLSPGVEHPRDLVADLKSKLDALVEVAELATVR